MTINRRSALRQLALLSAGAVLVPACSGVHPKPDLVLKNFKLDDGQQRLLEELTAALIPTTSTPGARDVSAHLFLIKMLDDCSSRADQAKFFKGMQLFDEAARASAGKSFAARASAGKSFAAATGPQRESLLLAIENKKMPEEDLNFFYSTAKKLTILAYSSSQFFLTKVQVYELVPARWHGCVPVKQAS
jgi:hypothetical protein